MEEKKETKQQKLTYEELAAKFNQLYGDYQKLMHEYQGALKALNNIDSTSFFLNAAFKILEHPEMYSDSFVAMCAGKVEYIVNRFAENMEPEQEESGEAE